MENPDHKATEDELEDGSERAVAATILMFMMIDYPHGTVWDVMDTDANNSWISIYGHRGIGSSE